MNFICFDTEDNSKELMSAGKSGFDKQVTQIACITAEGKRHYSAGDVAESLKWLGRQKEKFIYAHNIQYDLGNLFGDELDKLDCTLVGGRMIKAVWGNKIFVDSFNIWPMAAKKVGAAFGIEKMETQSMATDKEYVWRDVEIIRQAMLFAWGLAGKMGLKALPPTLGGLCIKVWKHWQGENCHDSTLLSREALFGGRVELFKAHSETNNVAETDINSLYPAMMLKEFPGMLEDRGKKLAAHGIAKVTIQVPEMQLCPLPFRNEDGRILYPWGKFTGTWAIPEINRAVQLGCKIVKVYSCYGTDESSKPYAEFVTKLYRARLDSKSEAEKLFFKLLMNNLYGRLGTSGKIGRTVWQNEKNKFDGVPFGDKVLVTYTMPLPDETNWSHAAYVTAYGRMALMDYLIKVGVDRLIYCDTDSCIFDSPDKSIPFKVGTELGQMKLVDWHEQAVTYAPKLYQVGNKFKAKGVPVRLAQEFIEKGHVHFDMPFKFREAVAFFDRDNSKKLSVWRNVEKFNRGVYDRKFLVDNRYKPRKIVSV